MSNKQLNFMDLYIARTITPDDPIKQIFDAIDWQSMAKFKPPKKSKKGRKGYDFIAMLKALLLIPLNEAKSLREIACDGTHLCAQPHDPEARWGFKRQTCSFFGYRVILLVSVKEPIFPIAVEVVPGNEGESPEFRKVIDQFKHYHPEVKVKKV